MLDRSLVMDGTPIGLVYDVLKLSNDTPHCKAELQQNRPIEHWKTHCVNCGSHKSRMHRRDDCPSQHYEKGEINE